MSDSTPPSPAQTTPKPLWRSLLKLARPKQWAKCAFVLIGPLYGYADGKPVTWIAAAGAAVAFALAASACYVFNDLRDRDADRLHPRKRRRPIASGAVSAPLARVFAMALLVFSAVAVAFIPGEARSIFAGVLGLYVLNVLSYSALLKHVVILDVISLACGFVLRVVGGCVATGIEPSPWLLNCTFFLAMFLSFGKRLGERRTMAAAGADAAAIRGVQSIYTDDLLRMSVVVTAVATLITYAGYVEDRAAKFWDAPASPTPNLVEGRADTAPGTKQGDVASPGSPNPTGAPADSSPDAGQVHRIETSVPAIRTPAHAHRGFYLLWLTMLPATYGLLRCIVMLERGAYDDPTELAAGDRPVQLAVLLFGAITLSLVLLG